jgi:hypothetical protein
MPLETFPARAVIITANGDLEEGFAKTAQKAMLETDTFEHRHAYGSALENWATASKHPKTSRAWEYAKELRDPRNTNHLEAWHNATTARKETP